MWNPWPPSLTDPEASKVGNSYSCPGSAPKGHINKPGQTCKPLPSFLRLPISMASAIVARRGWFVAIKRFCQSALHWASARQLGSGGLTVYGTPETWVYVKP